MSPEVEQL